jgi:putative transposase
MAIACSFVEPPNSNEGVIITMTTNADGIDLSAFVAEHLERAEPDLLRSMLSLRLSCLRRPTPHCGAANRSLGRTNSRNGH